MGKLAFCICDREADQRLCFRYIASKMPLLPKYKISQYARYLAYSDALKNSFPPGLFLCGIVSHPRPLRSLMLRFRLLVQRYKF